MPYLCRFAAAHLLREQHPVILITVNRAATVTAGSSNCTPWCFQRWDGWQEQWQQRRCLNSGQWLEQHVHGSLYEPASSVQYQAYAVCCSAVVHGAVCTLVGRLTSGRIHWVSFCLRVCRYAAAHVYIMPATNWVALQGIPNRGHEAGLFLW